MSSLDYLHGAAAQEHISNHIRRSEAEGLITRYNRVLDEKDREMRSIQEEFQALRRQLETERKIRQSSDRERVAQNMIKDAGQELLAKEMQTEARTAYDFVVDWIDHYSTEVSQEFVEGIKDGMRMNMPFSTSEGLRKRFMREFEQEAMALYRKHNENALTREVFDGLASKIAVAIITELGVKTRAEYKERTGKRLMEPIPGLHGPRELREHYGEDYKAQNFLTIEGKNEKDR